MNYYKGKDKDFSTLAEILDAAGIEMSIWSCGCCESPVVNVKLNGKLRIRDGLDFVFSNIEGHNGKPLPPEPI